MVMPKAAIPLLALALCLVALPAGALAEEAGLPGGRAGIDQKDDIAKKKADMLFHLRVKKAIDAGANWIAGRQQRNGSFKLKGNVQEGPFAQSRHRFGISALCFYTLADCGYGPEHKVIKKALAYLRKRYRSYMKGDHWPQASSYSLSLLVLGVHNLYVKPENRSRIEQRDRYGHKKEDKKNPCGYPKWARAMIKQILDWLMENQGTQGLFRYPGGFNTGTQPPAGTGRVPSHFGDEDLSNSQYVLLALWAGSRCGYEIKTEVLERIAKRLLALQEKTGDLVERVEDPKPEDKPRAPTGDRKYAKPKAPPGKKKEPVKDRARGFGYTEGREATGSMTTAGLSSLVIVKAMLMERKALKKDLAKKLNKGIWDAIAWCQENYDLRTNPGMGSTWHYYYLYGLERAFVIAGKRLLGEHDWYREGATDLIADQKQDGRWAPEDQLAMFGAGSAGGPSPFKTEVLDTCFALLFLKRATIKPKKPVLDDPRPVTTPSGG